MSNIQSRSVCPTLAGGRQPRGQGWVNNYKKRFLCLCTFCSGFRRWRWTDHLIHAWPGNWSMILRYEEKTVFGAILNTGITGDTSKPVNRPFSLCFINGDCIRNAMLITQFTVNAVLNINTNLSPGMSKCMGGNIWIQASTGAL